MNESTDTQHAVNREAANPGHSPYLQFGRTLKRVLAHPVGLVQTVLGGSPLTRWNPGESGAADLFDNMVQCVDKVGGKVQGIVWYQGESDAGTDADATSYAQRFQQAVAAWWEALADAELPVLTVQLNRVYQPADPDADRRWSQVREAQRQVARQVPRVGVVPALDLPLADLIHTSPAGNMLLGERLAQAALGLVYGQAVAWQAPDLAAARRREDRVELVLERPLQGSAKVHGGYGKCPATVPADMERFLPMLGFGGVEIV